MKASPLAVFLIVVTLVIVFLLLLVFDLVLYLGSII